MTWFLLLLLALSNAFWLLVTFASGRRMLQLEQAARELEQRLADVAKMMTATDAAVVQLLTHIPTQRGH